MLKPQRSFDAPKATDMSATETFQIFLYSGSAYSSMRRLKSVTMFVSQTCSLSGPRRISLMRRSTLLM